MPVHASAPTRLDLAGGTLDIWPLYLFHQDALTLNAAITVRAQCTLTTSDDAGVHIVSEDTGATLDAPHWSDLTGEEEPRLVAQLLTFFQPERVSIVTRSGSPVGAGLAGSSALNIALCGALARWRGWSLDPDALMTIAQNLEARVIRVPTGVQDYRPAMFGGLAAIEMGPAGVRRTALRVDPEELGARVVLAYAGESRNSGINNWEVTKRHLDGDPQVVSLFEGIRDIAVAMRGAIEGGDWPEVGRLLHTEWSLRKRLAPQVSTASIDRLIALGCEAGAWAGKVCGAGGGGCVLFLADPAVVPTLRAALAHDAEVLDVRIDTEGLQVDGDVAD